MDVVEAIDAWIDQEIDDLTDDELEIILEILDVVAASRFAEISSSDVFDDDIDELVELVGGDNDARAHTEQVLVDALYGADRSSDAVSNDDEEFVAAADDEGPTDESDSGEEVEADGEDVHDDGDDQHDDVGQANDELAEDHGDDDESAVEDDHESVVIIGDGDLEDELGEGESTDTHFLTELADVQVVDTDPAPTVVLEPVESTVRLRPFDELGPSFLEEAPVRPPERKGGVARKVLVPALFIAALAAFGYGMLQLVNSLDDSDSAIATGPSATETPEPTPAATAAAEPTEIPATAAPLDPSAPTPTPTPEPTPPPRVAIRLVTGDVVLATWEEVGSVPTVSELYDGSAADQTSAREIAWIDAGVGVIDADGNVLVIDPDARSPRANVLYEASEDRPEATEIAAAGGQLAIRNADGDITLSPLDDEADSDSLVTVWDAEDEGIAAVDISSIKDLVPFVLEDGDARMIATSAENTVFTIWLAGDQPNAFNVNGAEAGILLGVGEGAIARYRLGDVEGDPLESVWDPFSTDEQPAIGYGAVGDRTAVVLGNGAIVLADETGTGARVWDPAETEIRAFSAEGNADQLVVLLETGSVVRVPLTPGELIESVWDITDETLSSAVQVAVERLD